MTPVSAENMKEIPRLLDNLYSIVGELEDRFNRPFTPDGHLVGSLGEVIAAYLYGLTLLTPSREVHDAVSKTGLLVQIKATQGKSVAFRALPNHVIVIKLNGRKRPIEIYNGPGKLAWDNCGPPQLNGQRSISITKLKVLMKQVSIGNRIAPFREWPC